MPRANELKIGETESVDLLIIKRDKLETLLKELPNEIAEVQKQIDAITQPAWESTVCLSVRQREVLMNIQENLSNKEISTLLNITVRTVKYHVAQLFAKFHKTNRRELQAMRRVMPVLLFIVGLLFCAIPSQAQQGPPSVTVSWNSVTVPTPAALTYKLERATVLAGPFTQIANPSNTQVTDTAVTRGTTYFYRVKASCPTSGTGCGTTAMPMNGDSAFSNTATATIPNASTTPPVPTNLTIDAVQ